MSLKDLILAAPDLEREAVIVPEWMDADGNPLTVYVGTMTGHDRAAWSTLAFGEDGEANNSTRGTLLIFCLYDADGNKLFAPTAEDAAAMDGKNSAVLDRLQTIAAKLNCLGKAAEDAAEKNSRGAGTPTSG